MGRQRNNLQSKGKEKTSKRVLNEIEASKLSDIEFKTMVIRMLNELNENYKELQESYKEFTVTYISIEKDIETVNKSEEEINNIISQIKNTAEWMKSRLNEE